MALAWWHGGESPYRLFNLLDEDNRPLGDPEAGPFPPAFPARVKTFIYACALWADEQEIERVKAIAGVGASRGM